MKILVYVTFHDHYDYYHKCLHSILKSINCNFLDLKIINTNPSPESISFLQNNTPPQFDIINLSGNLINIVHEVYKRFLLSYDYIMRLDSDDFLVDNSFNKLTDFAKSNPLTTAICGGWNQIDEHDRFLGGFMHPNLHSSLGMHGACTLLKCVNLLELNLRNIGLNCQDGYATYIYLKASRLDNIEVINDIIFNYRRHGANISSSEDRLWDNRRKILEYYYLKTSKPFTVDFIVTGTLDYLSDEDKEFLNEYGFYSYTSNLLKKDKIIHNIKDSNLSFSEKVFNVLQNGNPKYFINLDKLKPNYKNGLVKSFYYYYCLSDNDIQHYAKTAYSPIWSNDSNFLLPANFNNDIIKYYFIKLPGLIILNKGKGIVGSFCIDFMNSKSLLVYN